jgi:hypothetical protein
MSRLDKDIVMNPKVPYRSFALKLSLFVSVLFYLSYIVHLYAALKLETNQTDSLYLLSVLTKNTQIFLVTFTSLLLFIDFAVLKLTDLYLEPPLERSFFGYSNFEVLSYPINFYTGYLALKKIWINNHATWMKDHWQKTPNTPSLLVGFWLMFTLSGVAQFLMIFYLELNYLGTHPSATFIQCLKGLQLLSIASMPLWIYLCCKIIALQNQQAAQLNSASLLPKFAFPKLIIKPPLPKVFFYIGLLFLMALIMVGLVLFDPQTWADHKNRLYLAPTCILSMIILGSAWLQFWQGKNWTRVMISILVWTFYLLMTYWMLKTAPVIGIEQYLKIAMGLVLVGILHGMLFSREMNAYFDGSKAID